MKRYAIGLDFGTLSVRALLIDADTGKEMASSVAEYSHGVMEEKLGNDIKLPVGFALQDPMDYEEGLLECVGKVMKESGICPTEVIGIGIDFTSSTVIAVQKDGTPLCTLESFRKEPQAYVKLWKHHGAEEEAEIINRIALERGEPWLVFYGGKVSSEWMIPKIYETVRKAPEVYAAADYFMEMLDWITYRLTGELTRSKCGAGYKAFYRSTSGYPSKEFFRCIDPMLENVAEEKLVGKLKGIGECAGFLKREMAEKMGLIEGIPIGVGIIDAHASVPGSGIGETGTMMVIVGTSSCHLMLSKTEKGIEGVGGLVQDGIMPGYYGYEAGQCCVGDHFEWFVKNAVPEHYDKEAKERDVTIYQLLEEKLKDYKAGKSGLLALDWFNGVRSPLMDFELTGCILGMDLQTKPEEIYLALIEATGYGTRQIIEMFEQAGTDVNKLVLGGGIPAKSELLIQIYADITGKDISVSGSAQASAIGAAILGIAAAPEEISGYHNAAEIAKKIGRIKEKVYHPDPEQHRIYSGIYQEYKILTDYFGRGNNNVMKLLRRYRRNR